MLKPGKRFSRVKFRRRNGDLVNLMSAGFLQEFIKVETLCQNNWLVLYKNDVVDILRNQVFLKCNEDVLFRRRESSYQLGQGAACHPIRSKVFKLD